MGLQVTPGNASYQVAGRLPSQVSSGGHTTKTFDSLRSLYNWTPDTARHWNTALARQGGGGAAARVNLYGDSITFGYRGLPSQWKASFATRLRDFFNARYGNAGTGVVYLIDETDDTRIVKAGTWTRQTTLGPFSYACELANTGTGNTIAFTPDVACDSFTIHYLKSSAGGTFTANVDGGTATNVNSNNASTVYATQTVSAGASGTHTLNIVAPASGAVYIIGFEATNGTSGVRTTRIAKGGSEASTLVGTNTTNTAYSLRSSFEWAVPDLAIITFGVNEFLQQRGASVYSTNMQTVINEAVTQGCTILLVNPPPNGTAGKSPAQSAYADELYNLADTNNLPILDVQHRWVDYTTGNGQGYYFSGDVTHPTETGYYDIARAIFDAIAGKA